MADFDVNYSAIDRFVHNLAMGQFELQKALSRLEDRRFERAHPDVTGNDPVFITSLPRAGTTLLLEILAGTPGFVSHCYRDMPFLLCPLTWDRLSRGFRKPAEARERAHGDGMDVSYDSVEAFEEILWRAFWPEHFEAQRIRPWEVEDHDEEGAFADFLRQHMRKIVALGRARSGSSAARRYVSKNNANIARLAWLRRQFPDARFVIPYREPAGHIASLARQHANFLKAHEEDSFALRYMETLGHLEFGKALRPIDFGGWLARAEGLERGGPDFWAEYWIAAFTAVLREAGPDALILSYDRLCAAPAEGLGVLESKLGAEAEGLAAAAPRLRAPTVHKERLPLHADRAQRIDAVLSQLDARALF